MILKLQRRIWENSLDFTEKSLNKMIKDEHFLHVNSFGMNSHLWWQKNAGKLGEIVLKQFNLPDKQVINRMQKNILGLERELNICKDRIEKLESEIEKIASRSKKSAKSRISTDEKSKTVSATARVKRTRKSSKQVNELFA
ncbi:MAG: hypothetical protein CME63_13415 [Halobacteriovoraceae bacterium]|nr:hypothetical protein [Halobacteriovoraceae bacterium]|tara:strand:- start:2175 stop:2597 length:423 start_codon:yes stop_codon:yes gene_type:complete